MPAPIKVGLDYFPFDVDLLRDRKLRKPKLKHGYLASVVYLSLLSILYKDKGYFIDYTDPEDVIWAVMSDLQGKYQPEHDTIAEVIDDLVACGLFSGDLYQSGIITSRRSQRTYYSATVDRKTVDICDDYWLLDLKEMKSLSAKHCYYLEEVSRANNEVKRANNEDNLPNYPQSKVKKSKEKKSKQEEQGLIVDDLDFKAIFNHAEHCFGRPITPLEVDKLQVYLKDFDPKWVKEALTVAGEQNARNFRYIDRILENWQNGSYGKGKHQSKTTDDETMAAWLRGEDIG